MSVEMIRIDDRLIHGQIIAGWCPHLQPDHLILCDDDVAASVWETALYKDAASEYKTSVCSVSETAKLLTGNQIEHEKVLVVVASPKVVLDLLDAGLRVDRVVVGGMHFQPGKEERARFIFVDDQDIRHFRQLHERGVALEGRDVPTCEPFDVAELLGFTHTTTAS